MRVQHNISAINANRNLNGNNNAVGKSLEKLSSGYRINRAGDDAAGLAISEKMRAQISCLSQAETNCNDGISLIQTAEGALTEVHSMLNRMVELAEQSANGTYTDETDRANLQSEVDQLKSEVDRISKSTNFNGINLLDGSLGGYSSTTTSAVSRLNVSGGSIMGQDKIVIGVKANNALAAGTTEIADASSRVTVSLANFKLGGETLDTNDKAGITVKTSFKAAIGDDGNALNYGTYTTTITLSTDAAKAAKVSKAVAEAIGNGITLTYSTTAKETAADSDAVSFTAKGDAGKVADGSGLSLQIGDTSDNFNQLTVSVKSMDTKSLGIDGVDVSSQAGAKSAVKTIKDAINTVSSTRGDLGAMQNRLEHTVNNLSVANENMTNAESRIRDTDMAKEMMTYTSKNILAQAAQSMLAQANQQPQQVLSLLQ